jgi:hypothetical protein
MDFRSGGPSPRREDFMLGAFLSTPRKRLVAAAIFGALLAGGLLLLVSAQS